MKGIHKTALLILGMLVMTGCGGLQDSRESLRLEMPEYQPAESPQPQEKKKSGQADYDLTEMNQDMLYATLFQILIDPRKYEGKTVRVKGLYHASTSRDGGQLRHCCVVRDSRGCCAQDMEPMLIRMNIRQKMPGSRYREPLRSIRNRRMRKMYIAA